MKPMNTIYSKDNIPASSTSYAINLTGLAAATLLIASLHKWMNSISLLEIVLLCLIFLSFPIIALEALLLQSHKRESTGLIFYNKKPYNFYRTGIKLLGLYVTFLLMLFIYWVFPEYKENYYSLYFDMLRLLLPYLMILAIPYFLIIDSRMKQAKDGYWQVGCLFLFKFDEIDFLNLKNHFLSWMVKLFFLPLMFVFLSVKIDYLRTVDFVSILTTPHLFFDYIIVLLFTVDCLYATSGYILTLRITDSHVKSTDITLLGWFVALACYPPFSELVIGNFLSYQTGKEWGDWLAAYPSLYSIWGAIIFFLYGIYVSATVPFGIRFSNLTNRGIVTNGPYRFTKHPAYISKNIAWWLSSLPFLCDGGLMEGMRHSILLLGVNLIYFLRARTEERHLASDPDYVTYAQYIEDHGIFARLGKHLPWLRFKPGSLLNFN